MLLLKLIRPINLFGNYVAAEVSLYSCLLTCGGNLKLALFRCNQQPSDQIVGSRRVVDPITCEDCIGRVQSILTISYTRRDNSLDVRVAVACKGLGAARISTPHTWSDCDFYWSLFVLMVTSIAAAGIKGLQRPAVELD